MATTAFSRSPSVTERISIRWGDGVAEEPTSTLVLTAPNGLFVDVRILKEKLGTDSDDPSAIDWAFGGIAHKSGSSGSWEHWVDSRSESPDSDSGTFEILANGDELEKGTMKNEDGVLTPYEEVWRDLPIDNRPGFCPISIYVAEKDVDGTTATGSLPTTGYNSIQDLKIDAIQGMMIRIGSWCQALVKVTNKTSVERWELRDEWKRILNIGTTWLPCARILHEVDPPYILRDKDNGLTWIHVETSSILSKIGH